MSDRFVSGNMPDHPDTPIAVLFTDLQGAAAVYKTRGDDIGRAIIRACNDRLISVIKAYKGMVVKTVADSVMAYFMSPQDAVFAAIAMQKSMRAAAQEQDSEPAVLQLCVAVHYGMGMIEERDVFGDVVNVAGKLIERCAGREILVTDAVYRETRACADMTFCRTALGDIPAALGIAAVYAVAWDAAPQRTIAADLKPGTAAVPTSSLPDILPLFRIDTSRQRSPVCFYCGSAVHSAAACPSKLLRTSGVAFEKLCTMSLRNIADLFREHYPAAVRPLSPDDPRHDIIMSGSDAEPAALCFLSFHEAGRLFQLRSLRYLESGAPRDPDAQTLDKSGTLRMAEDCLRVARHDEARDWLLKAFQEQPLDPRLPVLQGLLQVQLNNISGALDCFSKAYDAAAGMAQRRWLACLIARAHEIRGNPAQAVRACKHAGCSTDSRGDIIYYYATLCALTGAFREACALLDRLVVQSPRYCVMLALGLPNLPDAPGLRNFVSGKLIHLREQAAASCAGMRATLAEHVPLFAPDDDAFGSAAALCDKAAAMLREESVAGYFDIPGIEVNVTLLLRRALGLRSREIKQHIAALDRNRSTYLRRLAHSPYPRLIGSRFFRLREQADRLLAEARNAADASPPLSLQAVRNILQRMQQTSYKLARACRRLDLMQNACFALLCSVRLVGVFCSCTIAGTLLCVVVLSFYRAYETSISELTSAVLGDFARFGIGAGAVIGAVGAGFWFAKNIGSMYKKINRPD